MDEYHNRGAAYFLRSPLAGRGALSPQGRSLRSRFAVLLYPMIGYDGVPAVFFKEQ